MKRAAGVPFLGSHYMSTTNATPIGIFLPTRSIIRNG